MAIRIMKDQICGGTISKNTCHEEYCYVESFMVYEEEHNLANFWGYAALQKA